MRLPPFKCLSSTTYARHRILPLLLALYCELGEVSGQRLQPPPGQDPQCIGTLIDLSRLQRLSSDDEDVATFFEQRLGAFDPSNGGDNDVITFAARDVHAVLSHNNSSTGSVCLGERHRVRELVRGIPVFGADFVVQTNSCSKMTTGSMDRSEYLNTNTLAAMDILTIRSIDGYRSTEVNIPTGYTSKRSKEEAKELLSSIYGVALDKVSDLELEIYPTENRDYLAWTGSLLVEIFPGQPFVYQVIMDDYDGSIILQCDIDGFGAVDRQEKLQKRKLLWESTGETNETPVDKSMCTSCLEANPTIAWNYGETVECEVQTLYLNNTGKTSMCISGKDANGTLWFGPGPVAQYFWEGTYNCFQQAWCTFSPLPECPDAVSDVQFNAVYYFEYLQANLGIMGGLSKDAANPIPVTGKAHYEWEYCNAFYTPLDHTVHFGDCDCEFWSPLVSTDVVVHEITHGITIESSNLLYFMQSGGLNEAYSDIMACALEFTLEDSKDQPDFSVGESLGGFILRDMENPSSDGNSIDDFCMYEGAMRVHYASGFLNRAYVSAVRNCEASCGTSLSECAILMSNMFMYTNMESLSRLSDFKDAAKHTSRNVEEFFQARNPTTSCSVDQVRAATIAAFAVVGLEVDEENYRVRITCEKRNWFVRFGDLCSNLWAILKVVASAVLEEE